jgi:hypothetical protein
MQRPGLSLLFEKKGWMYAFYRLKLPKGSRERDEKG